jgi:hypothetical protein
LLCLPGGGRGGPQREGSGRSSGKAAGDAHGGWAGDAHSVDGAVAACTSSDGPALARAAERRGMAPSLGSLTRCAARAGGAVLDALHRRCGRRRAEAAAAARCDGLRQMAVGSEAAVARAAAPPTVLRAARAAGGGRGCGARAVRALVLWCSKHADMTPATMWHV